MRFLVIFGLLTLSFSTFAATTIPEVSGVQIDQEQGCGAPAPVGVKPYCPTTTTLTFVASSIGLCDVFSAKFDISVAGGNILTILKDRVDHCTRPEHAPKKETHRLSLTGKLPSGPIVVANPLIVNVHFRQ